MFELALFPLNTVLFPGMPLFLHIFEDRYKRMVHLCLENRQPFGAVLIRHGLEALGPLAEPHTTGCLARIVEVQNLSQGRMNITAVGEERFKILSLDTASSPYLTGQVENYPLVIRDPLLFARAVKRLRPHVERYLALLAQTGNSQIRLDEYPGDPKSFAYTSAMLLQAPNEDKQALLSFPASIQMMEKLHSLYVREVALLRAILAGGSSGEEKVFSRN
jgi:Lon protease-like protein